MLTFDKATHTYRLDGKIIPAVSTVVQRIIGKDIYAGVPKHILERSAEFGTSVHEMIEIYNLTGEIESCTDKDMIHCMDGWIYAKRKYKLEVLQSEVMIHYKDLYAGTFDCLALMMGKYNTLIDYKTTYQLHKGPLTCQLNLYRMGLEELTGIRIDKLCGMWLPKKGQCRLVEVKQIPNKLLQSYL